ncbi:type II toxin-antitoxin system VapC family toxin [uncultured Devosia sp.]|uniref:type II toxin-antitoxin system VapC family toxin n=1 Tax=uncultured Devosia sp. TaxID=211434 RepID=UPI0035CC29DF
MRFLLDTNVMIAIMRSNHRVGERVRQNGNGTLGLSTIVLHELYFGAYNSSRVAQNLASVRGIDMPIVDFNSEDAFAAGEIRAHLVAEGRMIGPYDLLIAAQATTRDLIIVTHNTREFARVPGLRLEDWETG